MSYFTLKYVTLFFRIKKYTNADRRNKMFQNEREKKSFNKKNFVCPHTPGVTLLTKCTFKIKKITITFFPLAAPDNNQQGHRGVLNFDLHGLTTFLVSSPRRLLCGGHSLLFHVYCLQFTVHCILYTVNCTLYTVNCTLYTVYCTIFPPNYFRQFSS